MCDRLESSASQDNVGWLCCSAEHMNEGALDARLPRVDDGVERARGFFRFVSRQFVKKHRVQELCLVEANLEHHLIEFVSGRVFQRRHVR